MKRTYFVLFLLVCTTFVFLAGATTNVFATTWDGGANDGGLWVTPTNWSGDVLPTTTDDVWINTTNAYVKIRSGDVAFGKQTLVGRSVTGVVLDMTGGTLTTGTGSINGIYIGQYSGSSGTLKLSGDAVINAGTDVDLGWQGGNAALIMTGGTINVPNSTFYLNNGNYATAVCHADISGGTIFCNNLTINTNGNIDISNSAMLIINGDKRTTISGYITAGKITACGGAGTVLYDYNVTNPLKTTVWTSCTTETSPGVSNPSPADAAVEQPLDTHLAWTAGSVSAASFRVYLGINLATVTIATPASAEYKGTVTSPAFDPGQLIKRGYTYYWRIDELGSSGQVISTGPVWSFSTIIFDPTDLGPTVVVPDWTGVRSDIPAVPAAGQHPRIYFSSAEKTAIANRWNNTPSGREAKAQLLAYTRLMELGYTAYNALPATPVRQDAYGNNRIGNVGYSDAKIWYDNLVNGEANPFAEVDATSYNLRTALTDTSKPGTIRASMAIMALYYYITDDAVGLQKVANATASWCDPASGNMKPDIHIAYCYDMTYNVMTTAQRDLVRKAIYDYLVTTGTPYGTYLEAYATSSNWAGLDSFEYLTCMSIEGETGTGIDPAFIEQYKAWYKRTTTNFLTYGYFSSGIPWEGQGKAFMWTSGLIAWARHGENFIAYPNVHAYSRDYLPALMQSFGFAFEGYDAWGGTGTDPTTGGYKFNSQDAVGAKWIFPTDTKVDFMYRNYMQYMGQTGSYNYKQFGLSGYDNALFSAAIFTSDYSTATWNQSILPTTTFLSDEGLIITRSDNATTAMGMQFHCRQNFGGHTHGDRNNFNLSGLGRVWGVYRTADGSGPQGTTQETKYKSCTLIDVDTLTGDGYGIPITYQDGNKSRQPGKVVDFIDGDKATFASGDATYAYSWEWCWAPAEADAPADSKLTTPGTVWTKVTETFNDFRVFNKGTEFYWDLPLYEFAHWNEYPKNERVLKKPSGRPMSYIYRTAGIVRGSGSAKPYALIVDDAKVADGLPHNFWWQMQLPEYAITASVLSSGVPVLSIESSSINRVPTGWRCDVILKEPATTGTRRLLVRVFQNEGYTGVPAFIFNRYKTGNYKTAWPVLIVESTNCLDPRTKIMLYPHYQGDTLPTTNWDGSNLTVTIGSQIDTFKFNVGADNRTRFTMLRNGCPFVPSDGDINRSGNVDFVDYANLAQTWPACHDFKDLAKIASHWME
jgi:hypothetical protein